VDASGEMLQQARKLYSGAKIQWIESTFERLELSPASVQLIVACLSFHFVEALDDLLKRCAVWLCNDGILIFSVRHPIRTSNPTGESNREGDIAWTVRDYFQEGPREFNWLGTRYFNFHRTLSTYIKMLMDAGLTVEKIIEPSDPTGRLEFSLESKSVPFFLTLSCRKLVASK
jgi:ubiquinone/menaquinone biosynthesis C-methylase UbiE